MNETIAAQLVAAGMSPAAAEEKAKLFARAVEALRGSGAKAASGFYVPGRIEVLGKHTDYAGGRSLVCAVERGMCLVAAPRDDADIRIADAHNGDSVSFRLGPELAPAAGTWANYPQTVARRVARNFPSARRGADIAFASDLPPAMGLSSSSALMVATFLALAEMNGIYATREYFANLRREEELAEYLACVENGQSFRGLDGDRGVGTQGGSEDHVAILCSRPGRLSLYSYLPLRFELSVALPDEFLFVIGASGVSAEKTGAAGKAYNRAVHAARAILEMWNAATGRSDISLAAALESSPGAAEQLRDILRSAAHPQFSSEILLARLEQFHEESRIIVPGVTGALTAGDWERAGDLVAQSQANAERLLGNQVPETIALVRAARPLGAMAASAFGAGFGGSVWAMVRAGDAPQFLQHWKARYLEEFPAAARRAQFFTSRPGPAATRLEL